MKLFAVKASFLVALLSSSAHAQRVAIITPLSERLSVQLQEEIDVWLRHLLQQRRTLQVQPPPVSLSRLIRDPELLARRQRAATLLTEATTLVEQMDYQRAREVLSRATDGAVMGLARLVDPRLLAEIQLQQGIASLPVDVDFARLCLTRSYQLWPGQQSSAKRGLSPKISDELKRAQLNAAEVPVPAVPVEQSITATRLLKVDQLLFVLIRTRGEQLVGRLVLVDASGGNRSEVTRSWPAAAGATRLRAEFQSGIDQLWPKNPPHVDRTDPAIKGEPFTSPTTGRGAGPWITGGIGIAGLIAGGVLLGLAHREADQAESKAGDVIDYYPTIQDHEQTALRLQTGAIVSLAVGGVAAAATLIWALWPVKETPARSRISLSPAGVSWTISFY